jgi:parvulin-like peptidyl-prolyl isomerase
MCRLALDPTEGTPLGWRRSKMKVPISVVLLAFVAHVAVGAQGSAPPLNGIAAIVNQKVITFRDVQNAIGSSLDFLQRRYADQPNVLQQEQSRVIRDGLEQLVERQLILDEFEKAGYPETLLNDIVDKTIKDEVREKYAGDRLAFTKELQAQGLTYERYRQQVRERIILNFMRSRHVSEGLFVSPLKIQRYYEANTDKFKVEDQVRLRLIVLNRPRSGDDDAVRRLAEEIHAKLEEGASFAEMAAVYSEATARNQSKEEVWLERSKLRKEFAEAAAGLHKGEHSGVIETPEAFYLLYLEDVRPAHVRPLAEVRDEIEQTLATEERSRIQQRWIQRLKAKAFVRYF